MPFHRPAQSVMPPIGPALNFDPGSSPVLVPPDFQPAGNLQDWRQGWSAIVTGKYSNSAFSALLCYDSARGAASFYQNDGAGGLQLLQQHTGWRQSWTMIVPGVFGDSGYDGLLLYDQQAGFGAIYDTDGNGNLIKLSEDSSWRNTWTHIVVSPFTDSKYSGVLFYDQSAGFGAIYSTDGHGNLKLLREFSDWRTTWTAIVPGQMSTKLGADGALLPDLFFYEGSTGYGETYATDGKGGIAMLGGQSGFPAGSDVLPGNFGCAAWDAEWTNLLFLNRNTNAATIFAFGFAQGTQATAWKAIETLSLPYLSAVTVNNPRLESRVVNRNPVFPIRPWSIVTTGNFWMVDPNDGYFGTNGKYPQYRLYYNGGFTDLLFYDSETGSLQFYLKEPAQTTPQEPICGYASARSVLPGDTIQFFVSTQVGGYQINLFRQGVERVYVGSVPVTGPMRPYGISRSAYRDGAGWPVAASFTIPPQWPSGLYFAQLYSSIDLPPGSTVGANPNFARTTQPAGTAPSTAGAASFISAIPADAGAAPVARSVAFPIHTYDIPFVVRPSAPGTQARILLAASDTTYEAYNYWGGRSLYGHGCSGMTNDGPSIAHVWSNPYADWLLPRALSVSFLRPFASAVGYSRMQTFEVPLIQWLQRQGFSVDLCAASDLEQDGDLLSNYKMFVSLGHDEYWSEGMRDAVENFISKGGNAAFLSGNSCWWAVNFTPDGNSMICCKDKKLDPDTILWNDLGRSAMSMIGTDNYNVWPNVPPDPPAPTQFYVMQNASHWLFQGTGLSNNDTFGVYLRPDGTFVCAVGGESNNNGVNGVLATATFYDTSDNNRPYPGTMVYLQKGSSATGAITGAVFNAASINWVTALSQEQGLWNTADQITWNAFSRMS